MTSFNSKLDEVFLSYDKILIKLNKEGYTIKNGKVITHKDLRYAISVMEKKHSKCRWKSEKVTNRKYLILIEGFYWLQNVFFQNEKSLLDADIEFFKNRINLYEELLKLQKKELFDKKIEYLELENYFNRKEDTIRKAIQQLEKKYNTKFKYKENGHVFLYSKGIELLCKECFKQKYLQILEDYKMELTEKYIKAGYIYDNFFLRN